jgi:hypothetical protein
MLMIHTNSEEDINCLPASKKLLVSIITSWTELLAMNLSLIIEKLHYDIAIIDKNHKL